MTAVERARIEWAARRLTAGVNAATKEGSDRRLFRLCRWAARRPRNMDAAFAAAQVLRDLTTIDGAEAAYLFSELFENLVWWEVERSKSPPDPDLLPALDAKIDVDLIFAALRDREVVRKAAFHRDRGEEELGHLILNDAEAYSNLCIEGQYSLVDDKPSTEYPVPSPPRPTTPPALTEHVLALSATETIKEWVTAWRPFCDSLRGTDPASAVAIAQGLRDLGTISFNESLILIDMAIEELVDRAIEADREYHRIDRAIDEYDRVHTTDPADSTAQEPGPIERQMLVYEWDRRAAGIRAVTLRQFGEHRMANLLVRKPEEYARIRDEESIGRPAAGSP